jgi:acetyl esterase/lipase
MPTVKKLLSDPSVSQDLPPITAFASINYRLSAYPHLTCSKGRRTSSFGDASRTAVHPAHINDVLSAIFYLQTTYGFDSEYLLVGHSCGATLALQSIMRGWEGAPQSVTKPCAVAGVEGIYDLVELSDSHKTVQLYAEFLKGAFGLDPQKWGLAAPTPFLRQPGNTLPQIWPEGKVLVLAHSREDELVEKEQTEALWDVVTSSEHRSDTRRDELLWIGGQHDQIWEEGEQMAVVVKRALECLREMD